MTLSELYFNFSYKHLNFNQEIKSFMKKLLIFLLFVMAIIKANSQIYNQMIIENNYRIKSIDGIETNEMQLLLSSGEHTAIIVDPLVIIKNLGKVNEYRSYKENEYYLKFITNSTDQYSISSTYANLYDTITKSIHYFQKVPIIVNAKNNEIVSRMEYPIIFESQFYDCNKLNLDFSFEKNSSDINSVFIFSSIYYRNCMSFSLIGTTDDDNYVEFIIDLNDTIYKDEVKKIINSNCDKLEISLKSGYYSVSYIYKYTKVSQSTSTTAYDFNSISFRAEANDTTIYDPLWHKNTSFGKYFKGVKEIGLNSIYFLPNKKNGWIAGVDGCILFTDDGGVSWRLTQNGKAYTSIGKSNFSSHNNYNDIQFFDPLTGWVVGEEGLIKYTSDGGKTWKNQNTKSNITENIATLKFLNNKIGFAVSSTYYSGSKLYYTTDGGLQWRLLDKESSLSSYMPYGLNNIWKITKNDFFYSNDMCKTWKKVDIEVINSKKIQNIESLKNQLFFIDNLNGWIISNGLFYTQDGGKTWSMKNSSFIPKMIFFVNKEIGWAFAGNNLFSKTLDGGENWINIKTNLILRNITDIYFIDEKSGWLINSEGFIFSTNDGGFNWTRINIISMLK